MTGTQRTFYVNGTKVEGSTPLQACKSYVETLKPKKGTFAVVLEDAASARKYHYKVYVKSNGKIICKIDKQAGGSPCTVDLTIESDCKIKVKINVLAEEHEKMWVQKWVAKIKGYKKSIDGVSNYLLAHQGVTNLQESLGDLSLPEEAEKYTKKDVEHVFEYARKCASTLKTLQNMVDLEKIVNDVLETTQPSSPDKIQGKVTHNLNEPNKLHCHFVVVTYWWGTGNDNKNLQYPCPEDAIMSKEAIDDFYGPGYYDMMQKRKKPTKTFEKMIEDWRASCEGQGCYYLDIEYPQFAPDKYPGMYQLAINAKPLFIEKAIKFCRAKFGKDKPFTGVVYIDGDMTVNKFPSIFNMKNVDMMARGWNIDPRSAAKAFRKGVYEFDPYVFETSGGIMFFGNTNSAIWLLRAWTLFSSMEYFRGKADDRILSMVITRYGFQHSVNIIQLPIEYLWLTDSYGEKEIHTVTKAIKPGDVVGRLQPDITGDIIFEHPACLTGEERAADQGASANRSPPLYEDWVTGKIRDKYHGGIFYTNIIFDPKAFQGENQDDAKAAYESFKVYLNQLSRLGDEDEGNIPPYYVEHKYLPDIQNIVESKQTKDIKDVFTIVCSKQPVVEVPVPAQGDGNDIITTILTELAKGQDVVIIPPNVKKEEVETLKHFANSEIELVYFSVMPPKSDVHFKMSLDNTPLFLSSKSLVLRHLLLMSDSIFGDTPNSLCNTFNSSYLFSSLIRTSVIYRDLWTPTQKFKNIDAEIQDSPILFTMRHNHKYSAKLSRVTEESEEQQ